MKGELDDRRTRKIIHIDMDAFYAAVEQRDHPEWRGKPVVVAGPPHSRSVVATASYEARKYGIHSAMPSTHAYKLCPHAIFATPRFEVYKSVSQQIMEILRGYTDLVEPLALDEAYLDVTINKMDEPYATPLARRIKEQILAETGLTASAGVSFNKFLAKLASGWKKPNGLTVITPEGAQLFVDELPIDQFYGVGKVTAKKMLAAGIHCGADLKNLGAVALHARFGKIGDFLYGLSICQDYREVNPSRERKSIGRETTFDIDVRNENDLIQELQSICSDVENTLRKYGAKGKTITLKVRYADFKTVTRSKTLQEPIWMREDIFAAACLLLQKTEVSQKSVRLMGVSLSIVRKDPTTEIEALR